MALPNDTLNTEIRRLPLKVLKHLETNARYMTADQQKRLTENISRDGGLTSLPLVWLIQSEDGVPDSDPAMFDAIVRTKEQMNVQNSAVAIGFVAELANERLAQLEGEKTENGSPKSPGQDTSEIENTPEIDLIDNNDKGAEVEHPEQSRAKKGGKAAKSEAAA
jgi:hypothetical protein